MQTNSVAGNEKTVYKQSLLPLIGLILLGAVFLTVGIVLMQYDIESLDVEAVSNADIILMVMGGIFFLLGMVGLFTRKSTKSDEERLQAIKEHRIFIILLYVSVISHGFALPIFILVYTFLQPHALISLYNIMAILVAGAFVVGGVKALKIIRRGDF